MNLKCKELQEHKKQSEKELRRKRTEAVRAKTTFGELSHERDDLNMSFVFSCFDETSLNGVPTLNQWCRIKEGDSYRIVTIECAGLLVGSTSTRVAQHVKLLWDRGQEAVKMLRQELGETQTCWYLS